jgi:predicted nuclease of restriction endonuclease-like RecB superfamily
VRLETPWTLEREVEVIDLKGTVFLPDFALRHPDRRTIYVEIVGFWYPNYLKRKLEKVRRAGLPDLILAVSERLKWGRVIWRACPGP